jgi:predicted GNAT family N-acyltransferase
MNLSAHSSDTPSSSAAISLLWQPLPDAPWRVGHFHRLADPAAFAQAMAIRTEVFVAEQHVPAENEQDALDDTALHFLLAPLDPDQPPVSTGRYFSYGPPEAGVVKIGRVAVLKSHRGSGLGRVLMRYMMDVAARQGYRQAILDAQTHALGFYASLGYVAEGEEFMDENIPHYRMRCALPHC